MFEVSVEYTFAAGHALRNYKGKCENVHGHNYRVQVTVEGEKLNEAGLLVDFADLKAAIRSLVDRLDHQFLNDLEPFNQVNPSAENLAKHLSDGISPRIEGQGARLRAVTVWETDTSSATYRP
ncbi:MAG TPA: 6-carboxytetrahydropterin synthase QueD [Terriglobia bacterium]|nr:6-carboxytetrahydropterin synthase QueD [Terriglobia bacterium]